jgi:hypothetical protein
MAACALARLGAPKFICASGCHNHWVYNERCPMLRRHFSSNINRKLFALTLCKQNSISHNLPSIGRWYNLKIDGVRHFLGSH